MPVDKAFNSVRTCLFCGDGHGFSILYVCHKESKCSWLWGTEPAPEHMSGSVSGLTGHREMWLFVSRIGILGNDSGSKRSSNSAGG